MNFKLRFQVRLQFLKMSKVPNQSLKISDASSSNTNAQKSIVATSTAVTAVPLDAKTPNLSCSTTMRKGGPMDMNSILRVCTELGPSGGSPTVTSKEDREFLENALRIEVCNVAKDMRKALEVLQDVETGDESSKQTHLNALDILIEFVEDIDAANDCIKMGGILTCFECLKSQFPEIRALGCTFLAGLVQNNPFAFQACESLQVLVWVIDKIESETETVLVKEKALYAVSCLLRDNPGGIKTFLNDWGLAWLFEFAVAASNVNVLKKCRYIIHSIYSSESKDVQKFLIPTVTVEYCAQLMSRLRKTTCIANRNTIMHIYWSILSSQTEIIFGAFTSPELGLVHIVKEYLGEYENIHDPYYSADAGELYDVLKDLDRALNKSR